MGVVATRGVDVLGTCGICNWLVLVGGCGQYWCEVCVVGTVV